MWVQFSQWNSNGRKPNASSSWRNVGSTSFVWRKPSLMAALSLRFHRRETLRIGSSPSALAKAGCSPSCGRGVTRGSASSQQGEREMERKGNTVRYTAEQIKAMIARGEDRTDWAKIDAMTE